MPNFSLLLWQIGCPDILHIIEFSLGRIMNQNVSGIRVPIPPGHLCSDHDRRCGEDAIYRIHRKSATQLQAR